MSDQPSSKSISESKMFLQCLIGALLVGAVLFFTPWASLFQLSFWSALGSWVSAAFGAVFSTIDSVLGLSLKGFFFVSVVAMAACLCFVLKMEKRKIRNSKLLRWTLWGFWGSFILFLGCMFVLISKADDVVAHDKGEAQARLIEMSPQQFERFRTGVEGGVFPQHWSRDETMEVVWLAARIDLERPRAGGITRCAQTGLAYAESSEAWRERVVLHINGTEVTPQNHQSLCQFGRFNRWVVSFRQQAF